MTDLHYLTLLDAAQAIKSRKISPVELAHALLDRIAQLEPSLHSYAAVTTDLALAQARQAETEIAAGLYRGPLHGIPIAVKDICNTAGVATAAGMAIHTNYVPDFDATVVKRLAEAGAVLLGKLQLASLHPIVEDRDCMVNPASLYSADRGRGSQNPLYAGDLSRLLQHIKDCPLGDPVLQGSDDNRPLASLAIPFRRRGAISRGKAIACL